MHFVTAPRETRYGRSARARTVNALCQSRGQSLPIGYTPAYPTHRSNTYARTKTHSGLETHRRRTLRTQQTRTQPPHRQTPPSPHPPQTRHTHPTSRPHRGRLANVHSQVAHRVSHRRTGRTHPSHARGRPFGRADVEPTHRGASIPVQQVSAYAVDFRHARPCAQGQPQLIRVHRLSSLCAGCARFFYPHPQPLSHCVGEGSRAPNPLEC